MLVSQYFTVRQILPALSLLEVELTGAELTQWTKSGCLDLHNPFPEGGCRESSLVEIEVFRKVIPQKVVLAKYQVEKSYPEVIRT